MARQLVRSHGVRQKLTVRIVGQGSRGGAYVLRIRLRRSARLAFGRFRGGLLVDVSAGDYAYVGSAVAEKGSCCLARRLLRHASRFQDRPCHAIRSLMRDRFLDEGMHDPPLSPPSVKRPKWNVDHLLDLDEAELIGVTLLRTRHRLESDIGRLLEKDPASAILVRGLGANDLPGNTHILRIDAGDGWWEGLPAKLRRLAAQAAATESSPFCK